MKWINERILATKKQIQIAKQTLTNIQKVAIDARDTLILLQGRLEAYKEMKENESIRQKTVPSKDDSKNP